MYSIFQTSLAYLQEPLFYLQIIFVLIGFSCGVRILLRDSKFIGNLFYGIGYLVYGSSTVMMVISQLLPENDHLMIISVRIFMASTVIGVILLYLGCRTYFKGSLAFKKSWIIITFLAAGILVTITQSDPDLVVVISNYPWNATVDQTYGGLVILWHIVFVMFSLYYLNQLRKSVLESKDKLVLHKINLIITGYILSLVAVGIYIAGNFGASDITDIFYQFFLVLDFLAIWRGLS
jgi:hypothetical protein